MKLGVKNLSSAVRLALSLGAVIAVGASSTAFAQDTGTQGAANQPAQKKTQTLQTVVVTGSRIRRVDLETSNPVVVIDRAQIQRTGKVTLGDLVQQLPEIAGAATNPAVNNGGGDGASTVSLRGLGSARTLLLLDGHRVLYQDLNSIPIDMIERVEVLKDGASAVYGSDAIGGVVNFITRKNYQGAQLTYNYGESDRSDGARQGFSLVAGNTSDKGSITFGVNYNKQDKISAGNRKFANPALYNYFGSIFPLGSSYIPNGRYVIPRSVAAANGANCAGTGANVSVTRVGGTPGTSGSNFRCYVGSGAGNDTYNYQPYNLEMTPAERGGIFATGNYQLTDSVQAYFTAFTQKTRSNYQLAPLPLIFGANSGVVLSKDSIYNPFGVNVSSGGFRDVLGGNRIGNYQTQADQINAGLRGSFGQSTWQWDAGVVWARTTQSTSQTGYFFKSALAAATGPSYIDANGQPACGTALNPIANCTPVNLFNPAATQATLNGLRVTPSSNSYSTLKTFYASANGELFNLPAGTVSASVGAEYRKYTSSLTPDFVSLITNPNAGTCQTSTDACRAAQSGSLNVKELYTELFVPVLADMPFVKSLNVTLGSRYSKYSAAGTATNSRIGLEYRPIADLLLRSTADQVFRAPTIGDLYGGVSPSADTYKDPCSGVGYSAGNPACTGVAPGFVQGTQQTNALYGSNVNLKPEKGKSISYGFVYDPHFVPGLSVSVDAWHIFLNDTLGALGTQTIINQCYTTGRYCSLFTRNPQTGDIENVNNTTQNIGRIDVSGVDFGFNYKLPETNYGNFLVSLNSTYLQRYNRKGVAGLVSTQYNQAGTYTSSANGGDGNYARLRSLAALRWSLGDWDASLRTRYVSSVRFGDNVVTPGGYNTIAIQSNPATAIQSFRTGGYALTDMQIGYQIKPWNMRLDFGVDNLFDRQPPVLWQYGFNGNTDERTYNTVGRYFWTRVSVKF